MRIIILAGGGGTRLWPLSKSNCPKQFLKILGNQSLLQQTVARFLKKNHPILVVTDCRYESIVKEHLADVLDKVDILVEPEAKNTMGAICLGARFLQEFQGASPRESVVVLPSDHLIEPESIFHQYLQKIEEAVSQQKIVVFGIRPNKPHTGFGYIKMGVPFDPFCYLVDQFVEKPSLSKAQKFLEDPNYFWNAGMFAFTLDRFWESVEKHAPEMSCLKNGSWEECIQCFSDIPAISIDYALIEKADHIVACPLPVTWFDVGSWDSIYEMTQKDQEGNSIVGPVLQIDSRNCLFRGEKKLIAAIGVEDILVVDTEEVLLIVKKGHSQKVKQLLEASKNVSNALKSG